MKFNLIVRTPGKMEGKAIPITLSQFLIGRDKQCQLRPASPIISNRHCALQTRGERAFVRDFESTNGTFVNDQPVKGEAELHDGDTLRIGPMLFEVRLEQAAPPPKPTPAARAAAEAADDEAMAALLLSLPEGEDAGAGLRGVDSEGVPTGSTVMDLPVPAGVEEGAPQQESGPPGKKTPAPKEASGDTAAAADSLLKKYLRRGRA